ncbi:MAG: hypothetical protein ABF293_09165 [Flavobacteriaceae bacterium]
MNHHCRFALLLAILYSICIGNSEILAQDSAVDSTVTPFRKGRWLTGITGTISSSVNESKSTDERTSSNEYALNILGGKFFKDRWLVGGIIQMDRSDADGLTDLNTESLFLGPMVTHYFSDSERGSLNLTLSPGYTRYNNSISFLDDLEENIEESEGSGFGFIANLGYSYVVFDRIAFDIGVALSQRWLNVERRVDPGNVVFSDDINLRDISFSFGFRVLLDSFLQ